MIMMLIMVIITVVMMVMMIVFVITLLTDCGCVIDGISQLQSGGALTGPQLFPKDR